MECVTQEHGFGCGVACVAAVLGCSYQAALKRFKQPSRAWTKGYTWREIAAALGPDYDYAYLKPKKRYLLKQAGIIVYVLRCKKYPYGHYLARGPDGWMNPWTNPPVIHPVKSGFQKRLPARAACVFFRRDSLSRPTL